MNYQSVSPLNIWARVCCSAQTVQSRGFRVLLLIRYLEVWFTRGLHYEAGFSLSELTSGKTLGFRSYDAGLLLSGLDLHGNLCWTANLLRNRLGSRIRDQLSESTACWPIRAQCAEFKAIKSYYRIEEIQKNCRCRKDGRQKSQTVWTWKWIEYPLPSSEQSDYYNISVKKTYLNICHNISNKSK